MNKANKSYTDVKLASLCSGFRQWNENDYSQLGDISTTQSKFIKLDSFDTGP